MNLVRSYTFYLFLVSLCTWISHSAKAEYFIFRETDDLGKSLRLPEYSKEIDEFLMSYSFPMNTNPNFKGILSHLSEAEKVQLDQDEPAFLNTQIKSKLGDSTVQLEYIPTSLYELILLTKAKEDCKGADYTFDDTLKNSIDDYGNRVHQINHNPKLYECREKINQEIGIFMLRLRSSHYQNAYTKILDWVLEAHYGNSQNSETSEIKDFIRKIVSIELEENKKGKFLLYRGMEKTTPEGALKTKQKADLKEGEIDYYYCRSLSYGASLYSGILHDRYERSACALIHMCDPNKKGYLLSLDKAAFRKGTLPFYFPPLHVTASFNGFGEFFHPRSKFTTYEKNRKQVVEGISIFSFKHVNTDVVNELMSVPLTPEDLDKWIKDLIQSSQILIKTE